REASASCAAHGFVLYERDRGYTGGVRNGHGEEPERFLGAGQKERPSCGPGLASSSCGAGFLGGCARILRPIERARGTQAILQGWRQSVVVWRRVSTSDGGGVGVRMSRGYVHPFQLG